MRFLVFALALFVSLPATAAKPFYLLRPQPILGHGQAERIGEVGKFLQSALADVGGYDVVLLDTDRREHAVEPVPPSAKLEKRWRAELDYAETNLRMKKPGTSIRGAKVVWRRLRKSPNLVNSPEILCRTYLIFAESYLQLGKKKQAEPWVRRLATSCAETYREGRWRAKPSAEFKTMLGQVRGLMTMVAPAQLTIVTEQAGADVFIDARLVGQTPVRLTGLPPGRHVLKVQESGRHAVVRWVELTSKPQVLRIPPQANWLSPAEAGLFAAIAENRIDDATVAGVKALLERVGGPPYLAIAGIMDAPSVVRIRLVLIDKRGRILRVPEIAVDESFLGLEAELEALFDKLRGGKLRWTGLNRGPIFKGLERVEEEVRDLPFTALAAAGGSVDGDGREEDKDELPEEDDEQEEKDRLRPVLRRERSEKTKAAPKVIRRRARSFSDFKDEDDK